MDHVSIALTLLSIAALSPFVFGAVLTTEQPILTWRRIENYVQGASPCAASLFRAFESFLMAQRGALSLQYIPISDLTDDVNDLDGAVRVWAIYLKKGSTATDAFYKLYDDAANSSTAANQRVVLPVFESGKETILFFPDGIPFANGLAHTSQTSANGTVDSTAGDGPSGFMLVGA